ncbi:hypothetical protein PSCICJ_15790 [Pseudomonas cichorii]|nr:hypothetical protein PSCICJ_15790 [Pseudomonas cichorii]
MQYGDIGFDIGEFFIALAEQFGADARFLENLPQHGYVWRFSLFDVAARIQPDTELAVMQQQHLPVRVQDEPGRGEMPIQL